MRFYFLAFLCSAALLSGGCSGERAQAAADARAGIAAAAPHADTTGQAILSGVDARIPAVAGVNSAELPPPAMTPAQVEADPAKYIQTAPPEPKRGWLRALGLVSAVGLPLLYILGRVAPAIPGLGSAVGAIADVAWTALAHRDQKAADGAKATVADAAGTLLPIAQTANARPEVIAALKILAKA